MTTFSKGDRVALITSWDNKGAMRIRRGVVHSSGAKLMRIQYENGEMFKTAFRPENNKVSYFNSLRIIADASDAELIAEATKDGAEIIRLNVEHLNRCLDHYRPTAGEAYINSITAHRDFYLSNPPVTVAFKK